jgi:ankyrin repeat protein
MIASALELLVVAMIDSDSGPLRAFLDSGGDPNARYRDRTLLHWCVQECNVECIRLLLGKGARTADSDDYEDFPLYQAAAEGDLEVARLLVDAGAEVNQCTASGTALKIACAYEHLDVVRYLVSLGADPTLVDKEGASALSIAMGYDSAELLAALREEELDLPD